MQEIIDGMKAEGFDTVRIPVYWGNMMADDGTYTLNPEYAARVKEIVDYCQKAGLYTVINIHHFDEVSPINTGIFFEVKALLSNSIWSSIY